MIFDKHSIDYQINMLALEDFEMAVPMTAPERSAIRNWVKNGHEIDSNPWKILEPDGYPMNYLKARRIKVGYSSGPWDNWNGGDGYLFWDSVRNRPVYIEDL